MKHKTMSGIKFLTILTLIFGAISALAGLTALFFMAREYMVLRFAISLISIGVATLFAMIIKDEIEEGS